MRTAVSDFTGACASVCSGLLAASLRKGVHVQVQGISACAVGDLPDAALVAPAVVLRGERCSMAVVMERELAFAVLDALLGGDGTGTMESRPFSDVERAVAASFMEKLAGCFNSVWAWCSSTPLAAGGMAEYFSETPFAAEAGTVVVAVLDVSWDQSWRKLFVCIPSAEAEAVEAVLETAFDAGGQVQMSAELGSSRLDASAAQELGVGDVVCVAHPQEGLVVRCGKKVVFLGQSGTAGDALAVRILRPYDGAGKESATVTALLGQCRCHWSRVLALGAGDVLALSRKRLDPVPVLVSGRLAAEGQAVVIDGRLGVRIKKLL